MNTFQKTLVSIAMPLAAIIGILSVENANATNINTSDIAGGSYIIGRYLFTREPNPDANYPGYLTTRAIMLAAKTIPGDGIDDMNIYYKKYDGSWVDGLTNTVIEDMPESFGILYENMSPYIPAPSFKAEPEDRFHIVESDNGNYLARNLWPQALNGEDFVENETLRPLELIPDGEGGIVFGPRYYLQLLIPVDEAETATGISDLSSESDTIIDGVRYGYFGCPLGATAPVIYDVTPVCLAIPMNPEKTITYHAIARTKAQTIDGVYVYSKPTSINIVVPGIAKPELQIDNVGYMNNSYLNMPFFNIAFSATNMEEYEFSNAPEFSFKAFAPATDLMRAHALDLRDNAGTNSDCGIEIEGEEYCRIEEPMGIEGTIAIVNFPAEYTQNTVKIQACIKSHETMCSDYATLDFDINNDYHKIQYMRYPFVRPTETNYHPVVTYYVKDDEPVLGGWGTGPITGYKFDGLYVARDCTSAEKTELGLSDSDIAFCPTDIELDTEAPVHEDMKWVEKWTAIEYTFSVTPDSGDDPTTGTVKIFADGEELTNNYVAEDLEGNELFNSNNNSVVLLDLEGIDLITLTIEYPYGEQGTQSFETTARRYIYAYDVPGIYNLRESIEVIHEATEYFGYGINNGYSYGNCTWWAKYMRPDLPSNLGNANMWAINAANAGFPVDREPEADAIFQTDAGWAGHVGYVERVNDDGSITVTEMNYNYLYNTIRATIPASQVNNYYYIHKKSE